MSKPEFPPRVWIVGRADKEDPAFTSAIVTSYSGVNGFPRIFSTEYLSLSESNALLAHARAEAFEEAALWFHKTRLGTQTFSEWCRDKAQAIREESSRTLRADRGIEGK